MKRKSDSFLFITNMTCPDVFIKLHTKNHKDCFFRFRGKCLASEINHHLTYFPDSDPIPIVYRRLQVQAWDTILKQFDEPVRMHPMDAFLFTPFPTTESGKKTHTIPMMTALWKQKIHSFSLVHHVPDGLDANDIVYDEDEQEWIF